MGKSEIKQEMRFLVQGQDQLTILQGQTPVIPFDFTGSESNTVFPVAYAVNFLRSGCPSVQLLGTGEKLKWEKAKGFMKKQFEALKKPDEIFHCDVNDESFVATYYVDRSTHD